MFNLQMFNKKMGLALGGGGARGIAHIGVLEVFEKYGLHFDAVSGTSAGSIIAALYANKIPLEQMKTAIRRLKPVDIKQLKIGRLGFFQNQSLIELFDQLLPPDTLIEQSPIPLSILCTDLLTGKPVVLTQGSLRDAVLASTCVPGIYLPIEKDGALLVDGGLTENVPLSGLDVFDIKLKVAVNLNGNEGYQRPEGVWDVIMNAMDIAIDSKTREQLKLADVLISLDLCTFSRTCSEAFEDLISQGKTAAENAVLQNNNLKFLLETHDNTSLRVSESMTHTLSTLRQIYEKYTLKK